RLELDHLEREVRCWMDHRERGSFRIRDERRAEHLVTANHAGDCALQSARIELSSEAHRRRNVVSGAIGLESLEEPEPLLAEGERSRGATRLSDERRRRIPRRRLDEPAERLDAGCLEERAQGELYAESASDARRHLCR